VFTVPGPWGHCLPGSILNSFMTGFFCTTVVICTGACSDALDGGVSPLLCSLIRHCPGSGDLEWLTL
jgi:hypothetical protein